MDETIKKGIKKIFSQCLKQINNEELRDIPIITNLLLNQIEKFERSLDYSDMKEAYKEAFYYLHKITEECVTIINRHDCLCASNELFHPDGIYELVYEN